MDAHIWFPILAMLTLAAGSILCALFERARHVAFFIMVFSTVFFKELSIYYLRDEFVQRSTPGLEIHVSDLCAIMLAFSCLFTKWRCKRLIPMTVPYCVYAIGALLSWAATEPGFMHFEETGNVVFFNIRLYPFLEILKMARGYFFMWVTTQYLRDTASFKAFYNGVALTVIVVSIHAIIQRYFIGYHRCVATVPGPNDFACYISMGTLFFLPFVFSRSSSFGFVGPLCLFLLGTSGLILSISRSCIVMHLLLALGIIAVSWFRYRTMKNACVIMLCFLGLGLMAVRSYTTIADRFFKSETISSGRDVRAPFFEEITAMMKDHPLGVGLGNFGAYSRIKYAELAGAPLGLRPHNIWYLTFVETGYIGLVGFILLWLRFFQMNLSLFFRPVVTRAASLYSIALGIFAVAVACHFQNWFHFCYQNSPIFFLMHIFMGLLCRLYIDSKNVRTNADYTPFLLIQH